MKWMKHTTNCSSDPKIRMLRAELGNEGYAIYWLILETVAAEFTKQNPSATVTLNEKNWRKICEISPKKLRNFLFFCGKISLLKSSADGELVSITVPNLLKYGDEYTKRGGGDEAESRGQKSGHYPDPVRASTSTSPSPGTTQYLDNTQYGPGVAEFPRAVS